MITVLLVEAAAVVRTGLRAILDAQADVAVVGEASDIDEAVDLADRLHPEIAVINVPLDDGNTVEATSRLHGAASLKILLLATHVDEREVIGALAAGAGGALPQAVAPNDLVNALRLVASGHAAVDHSLLRWLLPAVPSLRSMSKRLTPRESQVFDQIALGRTNAEIARDTGLALATIKSHVRQVLAKLGAQSRAHAVAMAHPRMIERRANREPERDREIHPGG